MSKTFGLEWHEVGRQDPIKILGYAKASRVAHDKIFRKAVIGPYRIHQYQTLRGRKEEEPYPVRPGGSEFMVYGPGRAELLCIVPSHRFEAFLDVLVTAVCATQEK